MERRAERRLVTCLFVDIVGSTDLTLDMGPERMKRLLDRTFGAIASNITERGGTVEKYVGDAIFALFGAPAAHADDPERALRAAHAFVAWTREARAPVAVRVGIETGEAVIDMDALAERQRMILGACVNLAARLQQQAAPGEILVGPGCYAATADAAVFDELGLRLLKGFGQVEVRRLARMTDAPRSAPAFVGREPEIDALRSAFARAAASQATLVVVRGAPGMGKTRLVEEFTERIGERARVLAAQCRPGTDTDSATPPAQLLEAEDPGAPGTLRARLRSLLDAAADPDRLASALAHSAGLGVEQRLLALHPFEREEEISGAWRTYLAALARDRPVLVRVEDLQWAEPQFARLVRRLAGGPARLLVVATARPELEEPSAADPDRLVMTLGPLPPEEARALAVGAGGADDRTAQRASGNPLFVIELARARHTAPSDLPLTLHGAIAARLDELPEADRELLQRASVTADTIAADDAVLLSARPPGEVVPALERLARWGFLERSGAGYRFHHALAREVAYGRLTIDERMRLHARYARHGVGADDIESAAHHWWEALRPPDGVWVWEDDPDAETLRRQALRVHLSATMRLADRFAHERAIEVCARSATLAAGPRELAEVEATLGDVYQRNAQGDEAWEHRLRAIDAYREAAVDPPAAFYHSMLQVPTYSWGFFARLPDEDVVCALLADGLRIARASADEVALAGLLVCDARFRDEPGELHEAAAIIGASRKPAAHASALQRIAQSHVYRGDIRSAEAAYARWEEVAGADDGDVAAGRAQSAFLAGDLSRAEDYAERSLALNARSGAHARQHALGAKGLVLFGRGDWDQLHSVAQEIRTRVSRPGAGCLFGAASVGWSAAARVLSGAEPPEDLAAALAVLVPESSTIRASVLALPLALSGQDSVTPQVVAAYAPGTRTWDHQFWDPAGIGLAVALTVLERWPDLDTPLRRLREVEDRGSRLCAAVRAAVEEEIEANGRDARPTHAALRRLGYAGISELLAYRGARTKRPAPGA